LVWKSFKKVRSGKDTVTASFLFDQLLEVNINCILGKTGFHRDPWETPGSLVLLSEQLRSFVYFTLWASVQEELILLA